MDLALNDLQWLICHENQTKHLKIKLLKNYPLTNHMYIYLNVWKQMTNYKLLLLHSNT